MKRARQFKHDIQHLSLELVTLLDKIIGMHDQFNYLRLRLIVFN